MRTEWAPESFKNVIGQEVALTFFGHEIGTAKVLDAEGCLELRLDDGQVFQTGPITHGSHDD